MRYSHQKPIAAPPAERGAAQVLIPPPLSIKAAGGFGEGEVVEQERFLSPLCYPTIANCPQHSERLGENRGERELAER
jgi:hypothetical protein